MLMPAFALTEAKHLAQHDLYELASDATQGQTSEVHITDLDKCTMQLLLRYMYGTLETMPASMQATVALFKAADKYEVMGLVGECMHIFHRVAQAEDVAPLLQVSTAIEVSHVKVAYTTERQA